MRPAAQISGPVSAWEAGGRERTTLGPAQVCGGRLGSIREISPWLGPGSTPRPPRPPIDWVLFSPAAAGPVLSPSGLESDLSKVRHKLRKFLQRRPTLQSLREKGYIRGMAGRRGGRRGTRLVALTSLPPRPGVRLRAGGAV